jgi:Na+-driven multidrug efflux pump
MAGETAVVNGFLASMDHPTEAIAAYSIFHRVMLFAFNPIIAASVALLPYTARHFGTGDLPGVRRAFRQVSLASLAYCVLLVGPLILPAAPWIAASLAESPVTADYTTLLLRLVPLACLLGAPFLLSRPVFEGMQRGRPGLVMATTRYLVLTPVAAWLGVGGARLWGHSELDGLVVALLAVSAVTSVTFWIWLRRALRERAGDA